MLLFLFFLNFFRLEKICTSNLKTDAIRSWIPIQFNNNKEKYFVQFFLLLLLLKKSPHTKFIADEIFRTPKFYTTFFAGEKNSQFCMKFHWCKQFCLKPSIVASVHITLRNHFTSRNDSFEYSVLYSATKLLFTTQVIRFLIKISLKTTTCKHVRHELNYRFVASSLMIVYVCVCVCMQYIYIFCMPFFA